MARFTHSVGGETYRFDSLKDVMAKASPARSGDFLAGVAASNDGERVAAQMALADIPLKHFLDEALIPYEDDEVTRLIIGTPSSLPQKWSSRPARMICLPLYRYSGPMKPTTVFTRNGLK